jgi:hypothetical protein
MGGLGNQLFQYAAATSYGRRTGRSIQLDLSRCREPYQTHGSILTQLKLPVDLELSPAREQSAFTLKLKEFGARSRFLYKSKNVVDGRYVPYVLGYDPNLYDNSKTIVTGFYQSYRYIEDLPDSFRKIGIVEVTPWHTAMSKLITKETLVIHIRRGDYEKFQQFGLLSSTYYSNAIEIALSRFNPKNIVCFSDNISTARDLLSSQKEDIQFINKPPEELDSSSLHLMSQSGAIVIANSSFSWWAAMLNQPKHVVAPATWFRVLTSPKDLLPPHWDLCESDWTDS